jgi:hypothetical protein
MHIQYSKKFLLPVNLLKDPFSPRRKYRVVPVPVYRLSNILHGTDWPDIEGPHRQTSHERAHHLLELLALASSFISSPAFSP